MVSKLLVILLALLSFFLVAQHPIYAETTNPNTYYNTNPDVPNNMNTHVQSVVINLASTLSCILSGIDPVNPDQPCLGIDPTTKKLGYVEDNSGGLIGIAGNMISFTYNIPVNTHDYGSYLAGNFGIAEPAYAQGVGFQGLSPVMNLWQAFRNITYIIFVTLFIVIGLGIMFRVKIDPRTVMTIQNQIPKIIVALVLVTFSYAIAGFMVDMMYVSMYIILSVFAEEGINPVNVSAGSPFGAIGGIGGMSGIAYGVAGSISGIVASIFDGTLGKVVGAIIGGLLGNLVGGKINNFASSFGPLGGLIGGAADLALTAGGAIGGAIYGNKIIGILSGVIAYIIVVIALFSALLRLWFILIKSYIYILLSVVLAPFYIAKGLIPGQSGFGGWVRTMIANLAVFPVTIAMFLLGKAFIDGFSNRGISNEAIFIPPMVGDFSSPEAFGAIIGLAIVLMTPEVANMAKEALKAPDMKYSSAVGQFMGIGVKAGSWPAKSSYSKLMDRDRDGVAQGWLGKQLGRNPITRSLFKTVDNTGNKLKSKPLSNIINAPINKLMGGRRQNDFNAGRRKTRPTGPDGNPVQGPELPNTSRVFRPFTRGNPPGSPPPNGGANGNNNNPPPAGDPTGTPSNPQNPPQDDGGGNATTPPIPHATTTSDDIDEAVGDQQEDGDKQQNTQGENNQGGNKTDKHDGKTLEELIKTVEHLRREMRDEGKDHQAEIASLEEKIKDRNI